MECIYGCYVHSAILPTFHRRCYWLLQNPDVVLVHYLNVPYPDGDAKLAALPPCLVLPPDKKEWTRDELAAQLRPMFLGSDDDPNNPHLNHSTHPVDMIVTQLLDRQRASLTTPSSGAQLAPRRLTPDNQVIKTLIILNLLRIQGKLLRNIFHFQVTSTTGGQHSSSTGSSATRVYSRHTHPAQNQSTPLVLSLQQIQGGGGLLILNSQPYHHQQQQPQNQQEKQQSQPQNHQTDIQSLNEQTSIQQTSVDREQQTHQDIDTQDANDRPVLQTIATTGSGNDVTEFVETLDLSQEDIQRTLSANMMPSSPSPSPADNHVINPMDFIDSSDDVLVNLDAFDVFGDLPELHDFETEQIKTENRNTSQNDNARPPGATVHIAEYSPEWSYTEGGVKVNYGMIDQEMKV